MVGVFGYEEGGADSSSETSAALNFNGKWVNIKNAYTKPEDVPSFNHGHMITYFVSQTAADGLPSGDIKSINTAAKYCMTVDMCNA